jgi:hypothetical protein
MPYKKTRFISGFFYTAFDIEIVREWGIVSLDIAL